MTTLGVALLLSATTQKQTEVWRWRLFLHGQQVEIYDVMKGSEKQGTGLRRIVDMKNPYKPKYENLIKPEWNFLMVVRGKLVIGKKGKNFVESIWMFPSKAEKGKLAVDQPVETPYMDMYGGYMSYNTGGLTGDMLAIADKNELIMGIRSVLFSERSYPDAERIKLQLPYQSQTIYSMDLLDEDFNIKFTINNARGYPRKYGKVWRVSYDTNETSPLTVFFNDQGEPVSPEIPLIKEFVTNYSADAPILAIPTSHDFNRFIPILPDGQLKVETLPTAGYYPGMAIHEGKAEFAYNIACWIKEYITPDGPRFGWANKDLTKESGPFWRSITWHDHNYHPAGSGRVAVGQLLDGSWQVYDAPANVSDDLMPHRPFMDHSYPTKAAALQAWIPIYQMEVAEPARAAQRKQQEIDATKWQEYKAYLGIDSSMSVGSGSAAELPSLLYATVTFLNARLYNDFDVAWRKLPGDYRLKYMAVAFQLRRIGMSEEEAKAYAAEAINPSVKATFESIARMVKLQIEQEAARAEEAKKVRSMEWKNPNKFSPRHPASTPGFYNTPSSGSSFAESSRRHEQYMNEMWKYLGGQQAWRPYK